MNNIVRKFCAMKIQVTSENVREKQEGGYIVLSQIDTLHH